jgi:hypothetical protein
VAAHLVRQRCEDALDLLERGRQRRHVRRRFGRHEPGVY